MDVFTKQKRSELMSCIRSRGNKDTELVLAKLLRRNHINGWRRNQSVFGKPDFVFKKQRLAIFVDGCFWHGCPKCYRAPKSNQQYWRQKINRNRKRDSAVSRFLRVHGWKVFRFWECGLRAERRVVDRLKAALG